MVRFPRIAHRGLRYVLEWAIDGMCQREARQSKAQVLREGQARLSTMMMMSFFLLDMFGCDANLATAGGRMEGAKKHTSLCCGPCDRGPEVHSDGAVSDRAILVLGGPLGPKCFSKVSGRSQRGTFRVWA